ncbi:hypothetical protein CPBF426_30260 [Xanthomonas arboricola pv. juglandis]|uniref:WapI family immunity protein n=1 Tax=Xanthomonas TaxID=338 RepID=UPI000E5A67B4|nr:MULTISPECIES: hypothetical protein [Xanthomonas]SYZ55463.1 hypothetical protein CPBF426_30260 [Xanthomonas arboricola pv. juglandis]MBB3777727.1 hypothetical protein [Xanthomonas euroxanthea]MBB3812898.1 hypothetical protein [Xanthomonas euroxanthea]CAD1786724.1 hypothetical protein XSP_000356 [Xanthomonas sp. CPBF 426]CAG2083362.1 hypothetical protein XCY_000355 [Xanthomonas euroxanthea]
MKISAHGLDLELKPRSAASDEGWFRVNVSARTTGFEGSFDAWLQTDDIVAFESELSLLYKNFGQPGTAALASAEPDIKIVLTIDRLGSIVGNYWLESERPGGVPTQLSGRFEADQSYIPGLLSDLETLLTNVGGIREA